MHGEDHHIAEFAAVIKGFCALEIRHTEVI